MIEKITVKKLIEFGRLSERRHATFIRNLQKPSEPKSTEGGGDYWAISIGALITAYKTNDNKVIKERIEDTLDKMHSVELERTKSMYQRNIDILINYEEFDFTDWRPSMQLTFHPKPKSKSIIYFNGMPIQIRPGLVFSYDNHGKKKIGGIWFIIWQEGLKRSDLGVFAESLYRYLKFHYIDEYEINFKACLAVDAANMEIVSFNQILEGEVPSLLDNTIEKIIRSTK